MAQVDMPKSSIGQTPTEPKKKLEKVVKGKVAVKEQSDMQKIASQFLAEDLKTVKDRILTDYLLPMLKNGAWSILNSAFSIARGQRNSYDGYYQGSQNNRPNPPPVRRSLQNLDFESRGDAEDTLAGLRDALYRYRQVSVGDLWDLMGVTNDSTDYNYGWYNLDDAFIKGIPGGFRLVLPHTVPLR